MRRQQLRKMWPQQLRDDGVVTLPDSSGCTSPPSNTSSDSSPPRRCAMKGGAKAGKMQSRG